VRFADVVSSLDRDQWMVTNCLHHLDLLGPQEKSELIFDPPSRVVDVRISLWEEEV